MFLVKYAKREEIKFVVNERVSSPIWKSLSCNSFFFCFFFESWTVQLQKKQKQKKGYGSAIQVHVFETKKERESGKMRRKKLLAGFCRPTRPSGSVTYEKKEGKRIVNEEKCNKTRVEGGVLSHTHTNKNPTPAYYFLFPCALKYIRRRFFKHTLPTQVMFLLQDLRPCRTGRDMVVIRHHRTFIKVRLSDGLRTFRGRLVPPIRGDLNPVPHRDGQRLLSLRWLLGRKKRSGS